MSAVTIYAATRLLRDLQDLEEQYSTNNTESTPITPELIVTRTGGVPTAPATVHTENAPTNNAEGTPATPAHSWRYNAMYAATFTLSALLSYIATEAICKRVCGRN